ncbi:MAG: hypothetical protein NTV71_04965, partial [Candidatus Omnitrophica bacterium]|nr:hypothetical protein [Candidatus Omnitrophota bacterium]
MFKHDKLVDRNFCFVLMPFLPELEPVYEKIKEIVVLHKKLSCMRADDIYSTGIIIKEIWDSIQQAQVVIADATGKNPNVFYEMGLAHAIGKDIIIIAQTMDDIPFDLRHRRLIIYDLKRLEEFEVKLSKTIEGVKWQPIEIVQWLSTGNKNIRIGLSFPTDKTAVHQTPIESSGRVVGLTSSDLHLYIQGFVITDREYEQGSSSVDNNGFWKINEIHLGATTHSLFFRISDESGRVIA